MSRVFPVRSLAEIPAAGSTFDSNGVRTDGPARRPLDVMRLTVSGDGSMQVDINAVSSRARYSPDQAIPYPA